MPSSKLIICSDCGKEKRYKAWGLCGACYRRRRYRNNPEKYRAYGRCYRKENYEKVREIESRYYRNRREERLTYIRAYNVIWRRDNSEKRAIQKARRRARKNSLPDTLTNEQAREVSSVGICFYCGGNGELVLDHFVPIVKGGGTTRANMTVACRSCNSSKRDRMPEEILVQLELLGI